MSDTPNINTALDEIKSEILKFREDNERVLGDVVTKSMLEDLQTEVIEKAVKAAQEKAETIANRPATATSDPSKQKAIDTKAAFLKFMRTGKVELTREEKALVEDATGQIIVPEDLESAIYRELPRITVIRNLATVRPTTSDRVRRRSIDSVSVGWGKLETGTTITESTLTPDDDYLYVEDLYGLTKLGEDELADTDVALESIISEEFARKFAEAEDTAFVVGTGHTSGQPVGILTGTTVTRVDSGQNAAVTIEDFKKLIASVPVQYRSRGTFIMHSNTILALSLLKDETGNFLWNPDNQTGVPGRFLGYSVYAQDNVSQIPASGSTADVAIFGDIASGYQIADRQGMSLQRLNELYAETGLIGFKAKRRVGGGVVRANAMRVLKVIA